MALASPIHPRRPTWDVIVVGARCAGSPTAMLLARAGFRVLLIDRAHFPSDSMRCHFIQRTGIEYLTVWGLLPRVAESGCPPIFTKNVNLGDFSMAMPPETGPDFAAHYAPRRYVLDAILVEAAAEAGASVLQGCTVHDLIWEDGRVAGVRGRTAGGMDIVERAHLVVGADGIYSRVARSVGAATYDERPIATCCYYSYFADVPVDGLEANFLEDRFVVAFPTNEGLTGVAVAVPIADFPRFRADIEERSWRPWRGPRHWQTASRPAGGPSAGSGRATCPATSGNRTVLGGIGGRCRPPQGPDSRQRHQRRLPQRHLACRSDRDGLLRPDVARTCTGRVRAQAERVCLPGYEEANARAAFAPFPPEVYAMRAALRATAA